MHVSESSGGGVSEKRAFFLLVKSYIGAGILVLPNAFYAGTFYFSLFGLIIIAAAAGAGMVMLGQVALKVPGSFQEISRQLGGPVMYWGVLGAVGISQICFSTAYMIISSQMAIEFYKLVFAHQCINQNDEDAKKTKDTYRAVILPIVTALCMGLVLIRKLRKLSSFSIVATFLIATSLLTISYHFTWALQASASEMERIQFQHATICPNSPQPSTPLTSSQRLGLDLSLEGASRFIGLAMFAFEGIGLVVPILRTMETPQNFGKVCIFSTIFTGMLYVGFAVLGFFSLAKKSHELILFELMPGWTVSTTCAMYFVAIVFSWPLAMAPAIDILQLAIFGKHPVSGSKSPRAKWMKNSLRFGLTLAMGITAYFAFEAFDNFLQWVGFLLCIPLSFICPGILYFLAFRESKVARVQGIGILIFGLVATIGTITVSLASKKNK